LLHNYTNILSNADMQSVSFHMQMAS